MGLFKTPSFLGGKAKDEKGGKQPVREEDESEEESETDESSQAAADPLGLRENPPLSARGPLKRPASAAATRPQSARGQGHAPLPPSGSQSARAPAGVARAQMPPSTEEAWRSTPLALEAANFLGSIALQTRGLFETVASASDVGLLAELLQQGPVPPSAALSGAVNPHAAATLLVFHLRDRPEGLLSKKTFARWLAIPNMQGAAQEEEAHALVKMLPKETRGLVSALFSLLRSVAEEHSTYYKDGLSTRITALSQLFGPLLLRPTQDKEHPMACRAIQALVSNPHLVSVP
eukprot:CAMPEP_0114133498 /NCGR_PEP_ID=MMETSP0043_2-20121206/13661_1 /TAXON_ID=464988 /ORGANISM="Hemiselmis andersenii, Strain CCMP644" /LENGTH=290 /DNA_ID=CAMNT_0001227085 /DNA_START=166 /DNA_END=1035 /DNA_ORIENTATION=-